MITVALILIGLAGVLVVLRLLIGPGAFDRLVAADTLAVVATAFLAVFAAVNDAAMYLDVAIVYAVIGFIGVVTIARFLQGADR